MLNNLQGIWIFAVFSIETHWRLEQTIFMPKIHFFQFKKNNKGFSLATHNLSNIIELKLTTALAYIKQENIV